MGALAIQRCECGNHDLGYACPSWVHAQYKVSRAKLEAECVFIGIQKEPGYPDAEIWNCHCHGSFMVLAKVKSWGGGK